MVNAEDQLVGDPRFRSGRANGQCCDHQVASARHMVGARSVC